MTWKKSCPNRAWGKRKNPRKMKMRESIENKGSERKSENKKGSGTDERLSPWALGDGVSGS